MTKKLIAMLLCAAMLLGGCAYSSSAEEKPGMSVYRVSSSTGGSRLVAETVEYSDEAYILSNLMVALNSESAVPELECAFPGNVRITSLTVEKDRAIVDMSREYTNLRGTALVLARGAIVLSLCSIDNISEVYIYSEGELLSEGLRLEDFSQADGISGGYERNIKLYIPDDAIYGVRLRTVSCDEDSSVSYAERVGRELLSALGGAMESTEVLGLTLADGCCNINLSREFYAAEPAKRDDGRLIVCSFVNSLCRVPGVDSVRILVEDEAVKSFGGYQIIWPMAADNSLIIY